MRQPWNFNTHRMIQLIISTALLIVILIFEVEVRTNGWIDNARPSPHYETILFPVLWLHILCAVATVALWAVTLIGAIKHLGRPPLPHQTHSTKHKRLGKYSSMSLWLTAITGTIFYYLAFICS